VGCLAGGLAATSLVWLVRRPGRLRRC